MPTHDEMFGNTDEYLVSMRVSLYVNADSQQEAEQLAEQLDLNCPDTFLSGEVLSVELAS